jgi:pilus assembly protein CpaD
MRISPLLLSTLVLLAGCAGYPADYTTDWTIDEAPKALQVNISRRAYEVRFAPGAASLGPAEVARLARFVADGGILPQDRIALEQADSLGKMARQRRDALLKALRAQGVGASVSTAAPSKIGRDRVVLEIERAVITPPSCPDWSKPPIDYSGQVASNFGCATASNLAGMIADPADLLRGNPVARSDGATAAGAIDAFHDHQGWGAPGGQTPFATDFNGAATTSSGQ